MSSSNPGNPVLARIGTARYGRIPNAIDRRYFYRMLATRHRSKIISILKEHGKLRVYEIAQKAGIVECYASLQLKLLRVNKITIRERRGRKVFYSLNTEHDMLRANLRFVPTRRKTQKISEPRKARKVS